MASTLHDPLSPPPPLLPLKHNIPDAPFVPETVQTLELGQASSSHKPAVSRPVTNEDEAARLFALAKLYNVDLADLVRNVGPLTTPSARTEEEQFHDRWNKSREPLGMHSRQPPQAQVEQISNDRFRNDAQMLPESSWANTQTAHAAHALTRPSSVFVTTLHDPLESGISMSMHGRGNAPGGVGGAKNISWNDYFDQNAGPVARNRRGPIPQINKHAPFTEIPFPNINAHNENAIGGPLPRQPCFRNNDTAMKYHGRSENIATFGVVDGLEGENEVFLRHGTHISSKAASSRLLGVSSAHAEQLRAQFFSQGKNSTKGGYMAFVPSGTDGVGHRRQHSRGA